MNRTFPRSRSRREFLGTVLGTAAVVSAFPALAAETPASQFAVESRLTCQCGCGLTVHSCNHLNCGSGIPLKKEIAERIALGGSEEEIVGYFQTKYGEKILSSPTTTGFNLAAWTVPFIAIGLGGGLVGWVLTRWRRSGAAAAADAQVADVEDPTRRARIEAALDDWDKRS